jgi:nitrogen-specific signal transduction histidine kinase
MRAGDLDVPWSDCIASGIKTTAKGVKDPVTLDGKSIVLLDWEVYPLTGGEDIPGWLVIARDRTDYYRLQELGERVERLVKSSDLLNVMAHEIRNPLATFKGLLQIIEMKDNSPDIKKYVSIGMREVNRLSLLLDEYMQLGKSAAISLERTEPGAFLGEVMPVLDMEFSSENVGFKTEFSETAPVLIDKRQMTQVIINLVKNAYEAIDRQGTITISLRQLDKNWVELTVSDTGPGIPEHIKKKLFRQYFTTKPQGTGLGLAVSHTIIQNHGGELSVHNNAGGGACFTIRLPICPAEPAGQVRKTDVLLITDDDMIRLPALHVFKAENITAFSISRPVNVMAAIERYDPLVIFIDEDFLEPGILKNLTQNICAENAKLKILIASDRVWESPIDNVCHIGKPVNYYKLVQLIKTLLEDNEHAVLGA